MLIINKKHALTAALMVGLGMAGTAGAFDLTTGGDADPVMVAAADIINAGTNIGINEAFTVALDGNDNILGRTTGFTIRYTLNNGATFGENIDASDLAVGDAARFGLPGAWSASIAAGGTTADAYVVISMNPGAPADCDGNGATPDAVCGLTTGDLLTILAATSVVGPGATGQVLDDLTFLQTVTKPVGRQISATVQFVDPVTAANIMTPSSLPVLESGDPIALACEDDDGDVDKTIDVGVTGAQASKTFFSSDGSIGGADEGFMNLGSITASIDPDFTSFLYAGTDEFVTVVNGDFSAFLASGDVFLSSLADCSTTDVSGVISNANGTVTFTYVGSDMGNFTTSGFTAFVCAEVPAGNTVVIDASSPITVTTTFTRGAVSSVQLPANCPLLPLRYNGSVVDVYHVNPAANPTAQSFIRVINPSDTAGTVTIVGIDDLGVDGDSAITFQLGARMSMQLNSEDLENGNAAKLLTGAWGDGAGKWRGTVTGEFPGMLVQGLNRNATDGTVTNLTDADNHGEQELNRLFE